MDLAEKIHKQLARNRENLDFALDVFQNEGFDTEYTMGQAIRYFTEKNQLNTGMLGPLRGEFHEASHILSNQTSTTVKTETLTGIMEAVLLRGEFDRQNCSDHDEVEKPLPRPTEHFALALAQHRRDIVNQKLKDKPDVTVEYPDMMETYALAIEIDKFFHEVTNGRAVYQLASQKHNDDVYMSLMDMPLCFFGVQAVEQNGSLSFPLIADSKREEIIETLQKERPHHRPVWDLTGTSDHSKMEAELSPQARQ